MRLNQPIVGFLIGLVAPFAGLFVMYLLWGSHEGYFEFMRSCITLKDLGSKVFTLALLANLIPFVILNTRRLDYAARGVFVITMLYVVFIVMLKYVW